MTIKSEAVPVDNTEASATPNETGCSYKAMGDDDASPSLHKKSSDAPVVTILFWDDEPRCGCLPNQDRRHFPDHVRDCPMISPSKPTELNHELTTTEWLEFYNVIRATIQWNHHMRWGFLLSFVPLFVLLNWYYWDAILAADKHTVKLVELLVFLILFIPFACWQTAETQKRHQCAVDNAAMFAKAGYHAVYKPVSTPFEHTLFGYMEVYDDSQEKTHPGSSLGGSSIV